MAGFKAAEQVEELAYDFNPHSKVSGVIPEPTSKQVEAYRRKIADAIKDSGLDPDALMNGVLTLADMDGLLEKSAKAEAAIVEATADLTGIANDSLKALPYRVQYAFLGWIMGQFLSPEA